MSRWTHVVWISAAFVAGIAFAYNCGGGGGGNGGGETASAVSDEDFAALLARVAELETLLQAVSVNGNGDMVLTGINLYVQSGGGTTDGTVNGKGNLIIGYDESEGDTKTGSHNLVIGAKHTYTNYGGLVAGFDNAVTGPSATVSGGASNTAGSYYGSVSGGLSNTASGEGYTSVSGGYLNIAGGLAASVNGGQGNQAFSRFTAILGGQANLAGDPALTTRTVGQYASVSGGHTNKASGNYSAVSGGRENDAGAPYSTLSGGFDCDLAGVAENLAPWGFGFLNDGGADCQIINVPEPV